MLFADGVSAHLSPVAGGFLNEIVSGPRGIACDPPLPSSRLVDSLLMALGPSENGGQHCEKHAGAKESEEQGVAVEPPKLPSSAEAYNSTPRFTL